MLQSKENPERREWMWKRGIDKREGEGERESTQTENRVACTPHVRAPLRLYEQRAVGVRGSGSVYPFRLTADQFFVSSAFRKICMPCLAIPCVLARLSGCDVRRITPGHVTLPLSASFFQSTFLPLYRLLTLPLPLSPSSECPLFSPRLKPLRAKIYCYLE